MLFSEASDSARRPSQAALPRLRLTERLDDLRVFVSPGRLNAGARVVVGAAVGAVVGVSLIQPGLGWMATIVGVGALFWAVRGASLRGALGVGVVSGLVLFGISSEWARLFGHHAYLALTLSLTLFWSAAVAAASLARTPIQVAVLGPSALTLSELARARFPLGGYGLAMVSYTQIEGPLAPLASAIGSAGVSGLAALAGVAAFGAALAAWTRWRRSKQTPSIAAAVTVPIVAVLSLYPLGPRGQIAQVGRDEAGLSAGPQIPGSLRVAIVQVYDENRPLSDEEEYEGALLGWLKTASTEAADLDIDLLVWPEGSLGSRVVGRSEDVENAVRSATSATGAVLLANGQPLTADLNRFVNRNYLFSPTGRLEGVSDKERLVPFGEYVPWRSFLEPRVRSLSKIPVDGTSGKWSIFRVGSTDIGSVICFESAFSDVVRARVRAGAEFLVVETNNRSFGYSSLSRQHVTASRMRAIETKRYLVHAALSGISAVIGPDGSVVDGAGLFERRVLVADVVPSGEVSLYVSLGDSPAAVVSGALFFAGWMGVRRRRRSPLSAKTE